jgi:WD40 repeat protein
VTSVALASDGGRAISGSSDQTARLWDLHTGERLATLEGHSDVVTAVSIDEAGLRAATGSVDRTIKLWRLDALRPATSRSAHAGSVVAIVFSPDGRLCASGGGDGRIMVRDVESGRVLRSIDAHPQPLRSLAFTDDGTCVLSSGVDHTYRMWTVEDGVGSWLPVRHLAPIDYCALSARARYLTTACADRTVYIWEVPSGVVIQRYGTRQLFDHLIEPSPRRRELPDTEENRDRYLPGEDVYQVALIRMSPDGRYAVLSATTASASRLGLTGACLLVLTIGNGGVQSLTMPQSEPIGAFAIDSHATRLLYAKADHSIELWDLDQRVRLATMRGHTDRVNAVGFRDDERTVVSCARDRTARVWNTETGEQIAAYTADHALRSLAFAPNDQIVALGDVSGRVHLVRLDGTGRYGLA